MSKSSLKPNVILLVCDQMRSFDVGCYGSPTVRTPNIDRLASQGVRFVNGVTNFPVCTPARSIMMTGQYCRSCTGTTSNSHLNPPTPTRDRLLDTTLPEALGAAGYRTALIGKWHVDPQPQLVGFDTAIYPDFEHQYYDQRYWNERGENQVVEEFANDFEQAELERFLSETEDSEQPFFLYFNIGQPHQPIGPGHMPERYCTMYDPATVDLRPNVPADMNKEKDRWWYNIYTSAAFIWRELSKQPQDPADYAPDGFGIKDLTALYYGAITMVDDYVGQVLAKLEAHGLADNTIIVFASDHGDNLGSHDLFNKGQLIEESICVPLIIRDPRGPSGIVADQGVASLVDIMPTLLDLVAVPVPDSVQGSSLADVVRGDSTELPPFAVIETYTYIGARSPTALYGLNCPEATRQVDPTKALHYDLNSDPYELTNLGADATSPLHAALLDWDAATPWLDVPPPVSFTDYAPTSKWVQPQ